MRSIPYSADLDFAFAMHSPYKRSSRIPEHSPMPISPRPGPNSLLGQHRERRVLLSVQELLMAISLYWVLVCNRAFLGAAFADRDWQSPIDLAFGAALVVALFALHNLLLAPFVNRFTAKPLLAVLIVATAFASYFMQHYGVYLDPSMLRNTLLTDLHEARELFNLAMLPHLLLAAAPPLALLWATDLRHTRWPLALGQRLVFIVLMLALLLGAIYSVFGPLASLMRNHKEMRYLITPANFVWSLGSVLASETSATAQVRMAVGEDAKAGPSWAQLNKPRVLIVVVGETARAANWGLNAASNGAARNTTPQLAAISAAAPVATPLVNFSDVTSCGTNTEVSLPCMFAPVGRRNYDGARIRGSESLLHVLARAGVGVRWLDNQSGCKGVCDGLPTSNVIDTPAPGLPAGLCVDGRCLDEVLLHGLPEFLRQAQGTQVLVLHMLGNHGPSYFRRYPETLAKFRPQCTNDDLRKCSVEEIRNAYDNALRYTDQVLAQLHTMLQALQEQIDSAFIYVSDHGESLGENNLYLHGLPYAIAPDVQKKVPMVMWLSPGFAAASALDMQCLKQRASAPVAHDHLFHTVLGLLDVHSAVYEPPWDLSQPCRASGPGR